MQLILNSRGIVEDIAFNPVNGIIAISCDFGIDLYIPKLNQSKRQWFFAVSLNQHFVAKKLNFSSDGFLVTCGTWLSVWEEFKADTMNQGIQGEESISWINSVKERLPFEMQNAEISGDGSLVAISSKKDKLIRVWSFDCICFLF